MADEARSDRDDQDDVEPQLFWRWVGRATRPVIGWILIGVAALLVLIGYFGVSREAIVAKQIPYVVSGGILGVLVAVVGAYFLGTEELRKDSGRLDRLERMVEELHRTLLEPADGPADLPVDLPAAAEDAPAPTASAVDATTNGKGPLVALAGSDIYHRHGCTMVEGKSSAAAVTATAVRRRSLRPCPLCEPVLA